MAQKKFSNYLRDFPPIVCRLLARPVQLRGIAQRPLTDEEIAEASGLSVDAIRLLSNLHSWDEVPVRRMLLFSTACGVDFDNPALMELHYRYLTRRSPAWNYLKRDSQWKSRWAPMIVAHAQYLKSHA